MAIDTRIGETNEVLSRSFGIAAAVECGLPSLESMMSCVGSEDVPPTFVVDCFAPRSSSPKSGLLRRIGDHLFTMGGGLGIG